MIGLGVSVAWLVTTDDHGGDSTMEGSAVVVRELLSKKLGYVRDEDEKGER